MDLAYSDLSLREKLVKLFRKQGVTVASILTAFGFVISTIALAFGTAARVLIPGAGPRGRLLSFVRRLLLLYATIVSIRRSMSEGMM